ncbi:MAG: hypothetical protein IJF80_05920 [Clostridia bacterium]|nr:hypothetical protein [Clostridia bacterium]
MARRTKQRSMILRKKRSTVIKRITACALMLASAFAVYFVIVFCQGHNPLIGEPPTTQKPQNQQGTVILLTTPTPSPSPTLEAYNTAEPINTQEPYTTVEPSNS